MRFKARRPKRLAYLITVIALIGAMMPLVSTGGAAAAGAPIDGVIAIPPAEPINIALTVENRLDQARVGEPVTTGVPLAKGQLRSTDQLWLQDTSTGSAIPAQFTVSSRWDGPPSDGSKDIKWILVDTQVDVGANSEGRYVLRSGGSNPVPTNPVSVSDTSSHIEVDTGPLRFRLPKNGFGALFDGIWVDGDGDGSTETTVSAPGAGPGLVLKRADGSTYRSIDDPDSQHQVEVESAGPLHTVIKISGRHTTNASNEHCLSDYTGCIRDQLEYLDYTVRIHAYADTPSIRVFYSITNPERFIQGVYNAGGEQLMHLWDDAVLEIDLETSDQNLDYVLGGESPDSHEYPGTKSAAAGVGAATVSGSLNRGNELSIYQDSSGVDNWDDDGEDLWGTSFQGYRVYETAANGSENVSASGLQAAGWATVTSSDWSMGIGVRHFWQNFPKGLTVNGNGSVAVDLWPERSRDLHRFEGGRQKTHEIVIGAWPRNEAAGAARSIKASLDPMHLMADSAYYSETKALGLEPAARTGADSGSDANFDFFEGTAASAIDASGTDAWSERFDEDLYGWRNWGDSYRNGAKQYRYFGNNEFDLTYVNLSNYLRSADHDRRFFDLAESHARHLYDIDTYHTGEDAPAYSHGIHKHGAGGIVDHSHEPAMSHFWLQGVLDYYMLTGDTFALDAAVEAGLWIDALTDDATGELDYNYQSRSQAWSVLALTDLWEATGQRSYLTMAGQLAKAEIIDEQALPGANYPCTDLDWKGDKGQLDRETAAVWANGYVAEALGRYSIARRSIGDPDSAAEAALVRVLDAIIECGWATQTNGLFQPGNSEADDVVYGRRYEELVVDRVRADGSHIISFATNQTLTDGFAYGYIFTGEQRFLDMADATWRWTMGPENAPGEPNPVRSYKSTSTPAKNYGFRQRFGHAYLWLQQNLDGGDPGTTTTTRPTTSTTVQPTTTTTRPATTVQPTTTTGPTTTIQPTTTIKPTTTTRPITTTTRPTGGSCTLADLDFESAGSDLLFAPQGSAAELGRAAGNNGSVLSFFSNNTDSAYLYAPDASGPSTIGDVAMSSVVRMQYHGSPQWGAAGAAHGFVLKTVQPAGGSSGATLPDAYIVTALPGPDGVSVRVGVAENLTAGTAGYEFRNENEGHSQYGDYLLFPETFSQDGQDHDLGYWQLTASLTTDAGNVHIAGTLTSADGEEHSYSWVDTGSNAATGEGNVGLVGAGLWSLENQFDDLSISSLGSSGGDDCGATTPPSSYSIDFEQSDSEDQFVARDSGNAARRTRANGGRVLNIAAFNTSEPFLFVPDQGNGPLEAQEVTMSADVAMAYYGSSVYGPRGSASGFLLKSLPANGSDEGAYIVSVAPTPRGLTMRIGATDDAQAGTASYHFLGESDGHTSAVERKLFSRRFQSDNRNHGLGFWHLDAELTTNGSQVTITAKLSTPQGRSKSMTWTDSGSSAYTGSGAVGLVNEGFWSIPNRYDNLEVSATN